MRKLVQSYRDGEIRMVEVPDPGVREGHVLVRTAASAVSVGTERNMVELARKSLLGKALERPDLARKVIDKARTEGALEAWRQARGRLEQDVPLGYSSAGVVVEVGEGVSSFVAGDRVACAGSGHAGHAELTLVPENLCVGVPKGVDLEDAAFVALGGIALEAMRLAEVQIGGTVAVIGLGLLGQMTARLLQAAGCRVCAIDLEEERAALAGERRGVEAVTDYEALREMVAERTEGAGADTVLIMAATASNEPLYRAAELARERATVVATGLVGLEVPRALFYEKELELAVSRGWGAGLYDLDYTERGRDYPRAYARWTAGRNMQAFLEQLRVGSVELGDLVTHRFSFDDASDAYEAILGDEASHLGVLLTYPESEGTRARTVELAGGPSVPVGDPDRMSIGVIGAGQFARGTMLPVLQEQDSLVLRAICSGEGASARDAGEQFGFGYATSDVTKVLEDPEVEVLFVLTRHGSHAELAAAGLAAGKHVFVEKPLALDREQLRTVVEAARPDDGPTPLLMVGMNRRFSPFTRWIRERFEEVAESLVGHVTVNAGRIDPESWIHDPDEGGGRIVGEVCHFVDLFDCLTGARVRAVHAQALQSDAHRPSDNVQATLTMADGSVGSITYAAGGDKSYPRERVELFGGGKVGVIENFKRARLHDRGKTRTKRNWLSVDRGHAAEVEAFLEAIRSGHAPPVPVESYVATTLATFAMKESLRSGETVSVETASVFV